MSPDTRSSTRLLVLALATVGALTAQLVAVSPIAAATPLCDGKAATIVGTDGIDFIHGTAGPDVIVGLGGYDHIFGGGGDDIICGNGPVDYLGDQFGPHGDIIYGGPGNDILIGGPGADELHGGAGNDRLYGGDDSDLLWPGAGDDLVDGGASPPAYGLPGADVVRYDEAPAGVMIDLASGLATGWGRDSLVSVEAAFGSLHDDTISGSAGPNVIHGLIGDDVIDGRGGPDTLFGEFGNDRIYGGPGVDAAYGGPGNDRLFGEHLDGGYGSDRCRFFISEVNCES